MKAEKLYGAAENADSTLKILYEILNLIDSSQSVFITVCFVFAVIIAFFVYSLAKALMSHSKQKEEYRILADVDQTLKEIIKVLSAFKEKYNILEK